MYTPQERRLQRYLRLLSLVFFAAIFGYLLPHCSVHFSHYCSALRAGNRNGPSTSFPMRGKGLTHAH
jgi:hypothetical protein